MLLSNEQFRQAIIAWASDPTRDFETELPTTILEKLEKLWLKMRFHMDDKSDVVIADAQALKALILSLKAQYPGVQP